MENKTSNKGLLLAIIFFISIFLIIFGIFNFYRVNKVYGQNHVRLYTGGEKGREKFLMLKPSCLDNSIPVGIAAEVVWKWVFFPERFRFCGIVKEYNKEVEVEREVYPQQFNDAVPDINVPDKVPIQVNDSANNLTKYSFGQISKFFPDKSQIEIGLYLQSEKPDAVLLTVEPGCVDWQKWQAEDQNKGIILTYGPSRELKAENYIGQTIYFNASEGTDLQNPCKIIDFKVLGR
jgi:hypothetical protein